MKAVFIRLPSHWGDLIGLKMKQIILLRFLGQKTTRDLFDILLSQESPTSLGLDLGEMVRGEVRGHSGPDGPS